ncbi:uncharacterized protein LOC115317107 [Ixodes scapularis]|uniref:uncharacterized protein LOC115317107 n=1 Tax=Ixodes scapularis TaxID=6945 RepID=UPI001C386E39|nr:uncharacterized protein LOC115317107 [Ixodes scapularis]
MNSDKSSKKPAERRTSKRSSSETIISDANQDRGDSHPSKLQKETETPTVQDTNSHTDKPDEAQPPALTEVEQIYMETRTLLNQFLEKKEGDFAFLSDLQSKIIDQVAQMIEGVRGKVGSRYDRNEATVRELVSAIGSALHRIDELDQKRLQFRQALASVLSLLGDD